MTLSVIKTHLSPQNQSKQIFSNCGVGPEIYLAFNCQKLFVAADKRAAHSWRVAGQINFCFYNVGARIQGVTVRWQGAGWPPSPGHQRCRPLIAARCTRRLLLRPITLWQHSRSGQNKNSSIIQLCRCPLNHLFEIVYMYRKYKNLFKIRLFRNTDVDVIVNI